jgi:hypothetical protein
MSDMEQELREMLQRRQPSPGFAGRVLRRVDPAQRPHWRRWRWLPAAVAASLLLSMSGIYWQRQHQAEQAKEQLMQALEITAQKIALVQRVAAKNLRSQE